MGCSIADLLLFSNRTAACLEGARCFTVCGENREFRPIRYESEFPGDLVWEPACLPPVREEGGPWCFPWRVKPPPPPPDCGQRGSGMFPCCLKHGFHVGRGSSTMSPVCPGHAGWLSRSLGEMDAGRRYGDLLYQHKQECLGMSSVSRGMFVSCQSQRGRPLC